MTRDRYVLRDRDEPEIARLELQHRTWASMTGDALDRAGICAGQVVLDAGCGPGFLALDLSRRVGPAGRVTAIDASERFIRHARGLCTADGAAPVEALVADASHLPLSDASVDTALCRWLLMFVGDPARVVAEMARTLRPGGTLVAIEYASIRSIALYPDGRAFARVYDAVEDLIRGHGGDPGAGARVPSLCDAAGLEVVETRPHLAAGRPGDPFWEWLETTAANHGNLVESGLLTADELDAYHEEWARHAAMAGSFFLAPPVVTTIARRR